MKEDLSQRMDKAVESFRQSLTKIRTGRIQPNILDSVKVNYYGSYVPLSQAAAISSKDATTLMVKPWEKNIYSEIEKALQASDLGINPINSGDSILVPFPPVTEERRMELIKQVKSYAEQAKISIRQIRRDSNNTVKDNKDLSEDEQKKAQDEIQKQTDIAIAKIDEVVETKEKDIMTV